MIDDEQTTLIFTKWDSYELPLSASMAVEDCWTGIAIPDKFKGGRIWQTPDGPVFTPAPAQDDQPNS